MPFRTRFLTGFIVLSAAGSIVADELPDAKKPRFSVSFVADFGADRGQHFGSLVEVRDAAGRVVAGAGFADVYNTRFRSDRHTLQFFVRSKGESANYTLERLPHPDLDFGIYLFDFNQTLYAWSSIRGNSQRRWNADDGRWDDHPPPGVARLRSGEGVMRLGRGLLVFFNGTVTFNGWTILPPPSQGRYYNFYYAAGRLFFFHTHRDEASGFTRVYACPWMPESGDPVDLSRAAVLDARYVGETPFAWGQFAGSVLTVSNNGGVYAFDGTEWKVLRRADRSVSFQIYSMLHFYDRLLLAQYPSGQVFEFQGHELRRHDGWPPRLTGVSARAREAQTLGVYGGDLFVGVWPWAELWRYDRDADRWYSHGRMFTHPEVTSRRTHPYEPEADRFGLVTNRWGQRVTGLIPLGDSLMISTSAKGTYSWDQKYDFLTDAQRREYGAVLKLRTPGNLAAVMEWTDSPTRFDFVVERDHMLVRQDGKLLASGKLNGFDMTRLAEAKVTLGEGIYGRFSGTITNSEE